MFESSIRSTGILPIRLTVARASRPCARLGKTLKPHRSTSVLAFVLNGQDAQATFYEHPFHRDCTLSKALRLGILPLEVRYG